MRKSISGWGRHPVVEGFELQQEDYAATLAEASLSRGLGRSYGDSSLPADAEDQVASSVLANRVLQFEPDTGYFRAEAGFSLRELNHLFLRRKWFSPVTPGTQFVTLGGMVAADVHGKNHHVAGTFGNHIDSIRLQLASGERLKITPEETDPELQELFWATVGGMGLTGHLLEVSCYLQKIPTSWIWQESERIPNLETFIEKLAEGADKWPYTVGWIDCLSQGKNLGRGILMKGRWASLEEAPKLPPAEKPRYVFPFNLPGFALNRFSIRAFNFVYYWKQMPKFQQGVVDPMTFFYPLDAVESWNRLYGKRGFLQHQCVLPKERAAEGMRRLLELLAKEGNPSFLAVIKDCGEEGRGILSFPKPGLSLALDLPFIEKKSQSLIDKMNDIVLEYGGRIYLAKDALTRCEDFQQMEPRLARFQAIRQKWDPEGKLRSAQSERLLKPCQS
ncbi:Decaprenylphosphoryl-beta-D-ribose oxidase [Planctomycetales bacterium 10988]|nr:Decaprenylphosphoryl-beta-D-ribose oxidase [Planctomycetales bacterium 10988]